MPNILLECYLLDVDYKVIDNEPCIRLFGVTDDKKQVIAIDKNYKPYFWVRAEKPEQFSKKLMALESDDFEIIRFSIEKKRFLGEDFKAVKVFVDRPASIRKVTEEISDWDELVETFETDVSLSKKYLVDKDIVPLTKVRLEGDRSSLYDADYVVEVEKLSSVDGDIIKEPKYMAFDIETYNYRGNPRAEVDPIIMISAFSSDGKKRVITWKRFEDAPDYVRFVEGEMELISEFINMVKTEKPLFLIGYNSDGFDMDYLRVRADKYKVKMDLGWDGSEVETRRRGRYYSSRIRGTVHLDIYRFIRTVLSPKLKTETLDLNSVASELLNEKKRELVWEEIYKLWDKGGKGLNKLVDYCLHDSVLTSKLFEKLMSLIFEVTKLIGQPTFNISRVGISKYVEWYLMRRVQELNELIPNKPSSKEVSRRMGRTYTGAFVLEPKPGLYKNIMVFDFRSLYPSIIVSHNISPDTLDCGCCKRGHKTPKINGKNYKFCKKKKGIMAQFLENLITRRAQVKNLLSKTDKGTAEYSTLWARSEALKLVANGYYGYLGFAAARWYCLECAEATTAFGRKYITETIDKAKKHFEVIYGDTDSIAMSLGDKKKKDAEKFAESINKKLPDMMQLEFEDFYPRGIFVSLKGEKGGAKKRYALINDEGEIIVRGFEYVRRDWSDIAKKTQMAVFEAILRHKDKQMALKVLHDTMKRLRENAVSIEDVAILTQLKKPIENYESIGPHVAAAIRGKARGYYAEPGTIIKYVVCKGKGSISERSHMAQIVKEDNLDYDPEYYINNQVLPAVERILKNVGFTEKEIEQKDQTELGKYF